MENNRFCLFPYTRKSLLRNLYVLPLAKNLKSITEAIRLKLELSGDKVEEYPLISFLADDFEFRNASEDFYISQKVD